MSDHKNDKWLYTFAVNKEVEVDKAEEQEINGEKVKVIKKVKENQPISFALKKPNRRIYEQADLFYGVKLSEGIRAGLLTRVLLLKRYRNDGGALSDADAQFFYELTTKLTALENELQRLLINLEKVPDEERNKKINSIVEQRMEVLKPLQGLETVNQALFAHTAETKAQNQLNNWWIVHLTYWDEKGNGDYTEFFPGENFDKKMEQWDIYDEKSEPFVLEALRRMALIIGLWNAGANTKEEFEEGEKDYATASEEEKKEETPTEVANAPTS